eukprot:scaffold1806_cov240-Pinguiococcus_pyrenoidosus.AAC.29
MQSMEKEIQSMARDRADSILGSAIVSVCRFPLPPELWGKVPSMLPSLRSLAVRKDLLSSKKLTR